MSVEALKIDHGQVSKEKMMLAVKGRMEAEFVGSFWTETMERVERAGADLVEVDAAGVEGLDSAGAAFLLRLKHLQEKRERQFVIKGLRSELEQFIQIFDPGRVKEYSKDKFSVKGLVERFGGVIFGMWGGFREFVSFQGEVFVKFFGAIAKPGSVRWGDTFLISEKSGANAVGITCMLGFLIGLIISFQSAVLMRQFAAEIYIADMMVLSLFRELGPLITAIVFAARSGSAYAAEIGTMKVNEEIDALVTMGIDPVRYLAVPRMISGIIMVPLLTMFNMLSGLIGSWLVMSSLGFSPVVFFKRISEAASFGDFSSGMVKTFVFGSAIAGIGCLRGLQTKTGASAVGDSATRAVVSSIIAIVIIDGIFAVVYFYLGI